MSEEDLKSRLLELGGEALARGKGEALDDAINQLVARRILVRENEIPRSSGERSELLAYHAAAPEPAPHPAILHVQKIFLQLLGYKITKT